MTTLENISSFKKCFSEASMEHNIKDYDTNKFGLSKGKILKTDSPKFERRPLLQEITSKSETYLKLDEEQQNIQSKSFKEMSWLHKRKLCKNFLIHGYCRYSQECTFAHGLYEIKKNNLNKKNRSMNKIKKKNEPCFFYEIDELACPHKACRYAHRNSKIEKEVKKDEHEFFNEVSIENKIFNYVIASHNKNKINKRRA
jgi:hypothetical protein